VAVSDIEFSAFVTANQTNLLRFAMVLCGDASLAQDLVQDALIKAHARWDAIAAMAAPKAYVKKMIVNGHLSFRRKFARVRLVDEFDSRPIEGDHATETEDRQVLAGELGKLPKQQRAVLVLRYFEGLSDLEIADVLGCSAGTVRGYASRALATLRIELAPAAARTKRTDA
jgi:RNA polymerase sigma-70 factor (sigma-E family)